MTARRQARPAAAAGRSMLAWCCRSGSRSRCCRSCRGRSSRSRRALRAPCSSACSARALGVDPARVGRRGSCRRRAAEQGERPGPHLSRAVRGAAAGGALRSGVLGRGRARPWRCSCLRCSRSHGSTAAACRGGARGAHPPSAASRSGVLLAAVTPPRWLCGGNHRDGSSPTRALVVSELLQRPNNALNAAHPAAGLPRLQSAIFGTAVMGYGDLFVAGVLGGPAGGEQPGVADGRGDAHVAAGARLRPAVLRWSMSCRRRCRVARDR